MPLHYKMLKRLLMIKWNVILESKWKKIKKYVKTMLLLKSSKFFNNLVDNQVLTL